MYFFGGPHRLQGARHHLGGPGPAGVVSRLGFEELGMREDDAELVVQAVEEESELRRLVHGFSRQQLLDAERARVHA